MTNRRLELVVSRSADQAEAIRLQLKHLADLHQQLHHLSRPEVELPASVKPLTELERESIELSVRRDIELAFKAILVLAGEGKAVHSGVMARFRAVRSRLIRSELQNGG